MLFEQPKRTIERVFLHCSASDSTHQGKALRALIKKWHVTERGWSDIAYQYLIDKKGLLMTGRPLERTPAAQKGHNLKTIAIMVHGLNHFSEDSLDTLHDFCAQINEAYSGRISFHGHCEVSNKSCPVFNYRALLSLDRFGRMP